MAEAPRDRIELRGVRATGYHGVFEFERRDGQEFVVDVVLGLDLAPAAATDALDRTVDYGGLALQVLARIEGEPSDLIETLAGRIADDVLASAPIVADVEVVVHKPTAPIPTPFGDVAVVVRRSRTRVARVALGANLGDRRSALQGALLGLAGLPGTRVTGVAPLVETAAVTLPGSGPQPDYLNTVVRLETALPPADLLAAAHRIEAAYARVRTERWGARTLDVDLLSYDGVESAAPELLLPHPRAHERAFVLVPWAALEPGALLLGRRVDELLAGLPEEERASVRPAEGELPLELV
uniref:2-amino-4-hydroxy-6- hydroxymethyldihydropteridine diphosphokinase n=1 Tax=Motilibacter rhizosphaerae TaxID=598652 RepID=UPI001E3EAB22|nr:2-amino-4-hydroxy-6-hydroxymethyldihydropteridine diphosphokinase [Motilibacter rhizosphaerae]